MTTTRFLLLAGIVFTVILIFAEGALWALKFSSPYNSIYRFDDELGYSFQAGKHRISIGNKQYEVAINNDSIIDQYNNEGRDESVLDPYILILGDNVVAGLELLNEQRLAAKIGKQTGWATINLATPGYGTVQQLILLKRWLQNNATPKKVFIIYNLKNDYYDNVQEWESDRIPTIRAKADSYKIVSPKLPNQFGQFLREKIVWKSKTLELLRNLLNQRKAIENKLPEQQKWLYEINPPPQSYVGDFATKIAVRELYKLAASYNFTIDWVVYRDLASEFNDKLDTPENLPPSAVL